MFWLVVGIILAIVAGYLYGRFSNDITAAQARLAALGSKTVETAHGPVEYVDDGEGPPVLVVHGIFGGVDQGMLTARGNLGDGFRVIAPSRFGYLGTPLPAKASPADQADAFAALMDTLGLEKAVLLGASAGGTSVIQFALRHPERCAAVVLISSNAPGEAEVSLPPQGAARLVSGSNFLFWLLTTFFRPMLKPILGVPQGFAMTPQFEAEVGELMDALLPVAPRADGALLDMYVSNPDINSGYPLEDIAVPVLVVNAEDDPLALMTNARAMVARIPGARLYAVANGGHVMLGHGEAVRAEISDFITEHS